MITAWTRIWAVYTLPLLCLLDHLLLCGLYVSHFPMYQLGLGVVIGISKPITSDQRTTLHMSFRFYPL